VHPGDLAGGCSDLEMTWLLYCAGAATVIKDVSEQRPKINNSAIMLFVLNSNNERHPKLIDRINIMYAVIC